MNFDSLRNLNHALEICLKKILSSLTNFVQNAKKEIKKKDKVIMENKQFFYQVYLKMSNLNF